MCIRDSLQGCAPRGARCRDHLAPQVVRLQAVLRRSSSLPCPCHFSRSRGKLQGLREHNSLHKGNPSNIQEAKGVLLLGWFAGSRQTQKGVSGAQRQGPKAVSTLSQDFFRDLPLLLQRQRISVQKTRSQKDLSCSVQQSSQRAGWISISETTHAFLPSL